MALTLPSVSRSGKLADAPRESSCLFSEGKRNYRRRDAVKNLVFSTVTASLSCFCDARGVLGPFFVRVVFVTRPEESAQPIALLPRDDVTMQVRNALRHFVVDRDERSVGAERFLDGAGNALHLGKERFDRVEITERLDVRA